MSQTGLVDDLRTVLENDAQGNAIYIGKAAPSVAESGARWQIQKLTYDGTGYLEKRSWANGSGAFKFVWNDRASYSYL